MRYLNIPMVGLVTAVLALVAYGSASVYSPVPAPDRVPAVTLQFDGDRAYQHVRNLALNFGSRVTGTQGGQASGDYIADQFRSLGLQVHTQRFREAGLLAASRTDMSAANAGWFEGTNILAVAPRTSGHSVHRPQGQRPGGTDGSVMAALGMPVVDVATRTGSVQPGYHNARDTVDQISAPALLDTGRFVEELVRRGDAMGAFEPSRGFLRTRLSAPAAPRSPLQYVEPWRMGFAGVSVLLTLSLPLVYIASRRPWQHWAAAFRSQRRAWYALLALVLVTALAAGTGVSWTGGGFAYLMAAGLLALGVVVTQTAFTRLTPDPDPGAGRLVLAAYLAAFVTWRPGAWWRLLDVLLLLPLLLAAGLQTHMAVLLAPLHLFPPVFVPLYAATHASATLAAVWGMFGRRPPRGATTALTQLPA